VDGVEKIRECKIMMRGQGSIYLRGKTFWIRYAWRGKEYRESAHTDNETKARKLLLKRIKAVGTPMFVEPKDQRYTLDDLLEKIRGRYLKKGQRSFVNLQYCWPNIEAGFPFHRVVDIDKDAIESYQTKRLDAGAAPASVNRETAYLKLGFKLLGLPAPVVEQLPEDNVRQGFIRVADFNALLVEVRDPNVRDIVEFLYHSGWRSSEPKAMGWHWLDLDTWTVRLPAEYSKNKKPRTLPLQGVLREIIERRIKARDIACPYVFHRNGKQIKSFRKAFEAAARAIGQPDLVPHDMRRSAVRNFRKAGLSESDGMKLSGHKTRSVYDRYDIIDEADSREAMKRAQEYIRRQSQRKVIPLKRKA
jgi:integrase